MLKPDSVSEALCWHLRHCQVLEPEKERRSLYRIPNGGYEGGHLPDIAWLNHKDCHAASRKVTEDEHVITAVRGVECRRKDYKRAKSYWLNFSRILFMVAWLY